MNIVDLFCGVGGFAIGAEQAGMNVVLSVDNDVKVTSSFYCNFNSKLLIADLAKLRAKTIAGEVNTDIDGILGGPPCQGFSYIGLREVDDPRNKLVDKYFYYVEKLRPKFFVFENVPGFACGVGRSLLQNAMKRLQEYELVGPMMLNAADYGAPTNRQRLFIVGYKKRHFDFMNKQVFFQSKKTALVTVRDAISDLPNPGPRPTYNSNQFSWGEYLSDPKSEYSKFLRQCRKLEVPSAMKEYKKNGGVSGINFTRHTPAVIRRFKKVKPGKIDVISRYKRLENDGLCTTLRAGTGADRGSFQAARPIHPSQPRVITIREAARLQGFPDWFLFHPTAWHSFRMLGNSVPPLLARGVLEVIALHSK